jgi:hypothetical protein
MTILPTFVEAVAGACAMAVVGGAITAVVFGARWLVERGDRVLAHQYNAWAFGGACIWAYAAVVLVYHVARAAHDPGDLRVWYDAMPPRLARIADYTSYANVFLALYGLNAGRKLRFPLEDAGFGRWWWVPVALTMTAVFCAGAYLPRLL